MFIWKAFLVLQDQVHYNQTNWRWVCAQSTLHITNRISHCWGLVYTVTCISLTEGKGSCQLCLKATHLSQINKSMCRKYFALVLVHLSN